MAPPSASPPPGGAPASSPSASPRGSGWHWRALGPGDPVGVDLVERLAFEERPGERLELVAVGLELGERRALALLEDPPHLLVDELAGALGRVAGAGEERRLVVWAGEHRH